MKYCTGGCENVVTTPHGSPTFTQDLLLVRLSSFFTSAALTAHIISSQPSMNTLIGVLSEGLQVEDPHLNRLILDLLRFGGTLPCEQRYLNLE
jgi:hypothetical protein